MINAVSLSVILSRNRDLPRNYKNLSKRHSLVEIIPGSLR